MLTLTGVDPTQVSFHQDGSCRLTDNVEGWEFTWPSLSALAADWLAEWQTNEYGRACDFIDTACQDAVPGVVDALIVLAEVADREAHKTSWVGAGPLEHLLSHSGKGLRVVGEVALAAGRRPAFRDALDFVILPQEVEAKLAGLGIQVRPAQRATPAEEPPRPHS